MIVEDDEHITSVAELIPLAWKRRSRKTANETQKRAPENSGARFDCCAVTGLDHDPAVGAYYLAVRNEAASEARKKRTSATSSGVPRRQSGVSSASAARADGSSAAFMSVVDHAGRHAVYADAEGPSLFGKRFS